jgi:hypothetical protein
MVSWPASLGVKSPRLDFCCCQTASGLLMWGALSYERTGLSFTKLLLVLASAVILGSKSCETHDHILLAQVRHSPNLEGQVPVFIFPRNRVALGSLFIASKSKSKSKLKLCYDQWSVGQCQSPIQGPRPDVHYCQTVVGLLTWGAISDEKMDLSVTTAADLASAVILGSESCGTNDHIVQFLGVYLISSAPIVHLTPLKTPFGLLISLFTIPITRHYNRSQLSTTRVRVYTIIIITHS